MSKLKIGKYLCISWMVLATALIAQQSYKLSEIENQQSAQYSAVSTALGVTGSDIEQLKQSQNIKVNRTGEFE